MVRTRNAPEKSVVYGSRKIAPIATHVAVQTTQRTSGPTNGTPATAARPRSNSFDRAISHAMP